MPLSSKNLALFYSHVAKSLEAGLSLPASIEGAPGLKEEQSKFLSRQFYSGDDPRTILERSDLFSHFDRLLLGAASQTARLPDMLEMLAAHHELRVKTGRTIQGVLLYPVLLMHMAALVMPILSGINLSEGGYQGNLVSYLEEALILIGWMWGGIGLLWVLFSSEIPVLRPLKSIIPGVGSFIRFSALSRFSLALSAFLDAGFNMARAWGRAGQLSQDPKIMKASKGIADAIERGEAPGKLMEPTRAFPKDFVAIYKTGESTGSLVEALEKQSERYAETARTSLAVLGVLLPMAVMIVVAGLIGYQVITFYSQYFSQIENIL